MRLIKELKRETVLTAYHYGDYEKKIITYQKMFSWCNENLYEVTGVGKEEQIINMTFSNKNFLTKIQIPVIKKY